MLAGRQQSRLASQVALADMFIRAARATASCRELAGLMEAVSADLGFRYYALIHHADLRRSPVGLVNIREYPEAVSARIIRECRYRHDPVMRACAFSDGAFLWSELPQIIRLDRRDHCCLDEGRAAGLNMGITVPSPMLGDYMGSCTFAGIKRVTRAARLLGPVQMIGIFAFQAARRIISGPRQPASQRRLHPRPRDCIVLAGRGLSNKEIARALSLTPRTVDGYMTEARQLFNAHSRVELVISAVFAGEVGLQELKLDQPE